MIENQSDNIDIKENDVSNQDNTSEDKSSGAISWLETTFSLLSILSD